MTTEKKHVVVMVDSGKLFEHTVLENIPRLAPDQLNALEESIKTHGLMDPITVVADPEHEGAYLIIDGRHRFQVLRKTGQPIPCIVEDGIDPLTLAIEKAIQGRQLTKSGVVLMLFLNHPELTADRAKRRGGRPSNKAEMETGEKFTSFRSLAEKYHVPYEYFVHLADVWDEADDDVRELIKQKIFVEEVCMARLASMLGGAIATKGKRRADPNYAQIGASALTTVRRAFEGWEKIKWNPKDKRQSREWAMDRATEMFNAMPDDLRECNAQSIVATWKPHQKQALLKALKAKQA
jgi:hypothetical protein